MSWKLFGQIALLMVIGAIILLTLKYAGCRIYRANKYYMMKAKTAGAASEMPHNRGMMKGGRMHTR